MEVVYQIYFLDCSKLGRSNAEITQFCLIYISQISFGCIVYVVVWWERFGDLKKASTTNILYHNIDLLKPKNFWWVGKFIQFHFCGLILKPRICWFLGLPTFLTHRWRDVRKRTFKRKAVVFWSVYTCNSIVKLGSKWRWEWKWYVLILILIHGGCNF